MPHASGREENGVGVGDSGHSWRHSWRLLQGSRFDSNREELGVT